MTRNIKKCVVCGKEFYCSPSRNIVTCSRECRLIHLSQIHKGSKRSDESKNKMSIARQKNPRNIEIQQKATEASKKSSKSGRFETNCRGKYYAAAHGSQSDPGGLAFSKPRRKTFLYTFVIVLA